MPRLAACALFALGLVWTNLGSAHQWSMPGYSPLGDGGKVEEVSTKGVKFSNGKTPGWYAQVTPQSRIILSGTGNLDFLQPKQAIKLTATIDDDGNIAEPIKQIEIYTPAPKSALGLFSPGSQGANPKPLPPVLLFRDLSNRKNG